MPVYNAEKYLRKAIDSILAQTLTDLEFIIVDDGSTDGTLQLLASYEDKRIRTVENASALGIPAARNRGLRLARGKYIAVQDADDVSLPTRLEKQALFLEASPKVGLVGSAYWIIDSEDRIMGLVRFPTSNASIQVDSLLYYPFCHGATMFRTACVEEMGRYDLRFPLVEDYDFVLRIGEQFELANIDEPLYKWRSHAISVTAERQEFQRDLMKRAVELAIVRRSRGEHQLGPLYDLALARHYLREAIGNCAKDDLVNVQAAMREALARDPTLLNAADLICWCIEHFTVAPGCASADPVAVARRFFEHVPQDGTASKDTRRQVMAKCHVLAAFASHRSDDWAKVRQHVIRALWNDARWIRNRGVISIGLESLVGQRAMRFARQMVRRLRRRNAATREV